MFGAIVSGRLVQTGRRKFLPKRKDLNVFVSDFQQIDESKLLINIADADNLNYLVIFLTGVIPLPLGTAAGKFEPQFSVSPVAKDSFPGVYFSWPDPNSPPKWQYLGHISNSKPSAIFKISQFKKLHEIEDSAMSELFGSSQISHIAQIGISIEPESSIIQQTPSVTSDANTYYVFGKKMLENFVNFASSYTVSQSQMSPNLSETYVPLSTLMNWFTNFQRRLEQNPNFWK